MKSIYDKLNCFECPFSNLKGIYTDEDMKLIDDNHSAMTYNTNDILIKQGSYVSQLFYLKTGLVKVVLEDGNGKHTILQLLEASQFIALAMLGDFDTFPFTVIALDKCDVCVIRKSVMVKMVKTNVKLNTFLLDYFYKDYKFLYERINTLSSRNNHGKLASALLYLSNGSFRQDLLKKISRKELAQLASISVESSNKILMELKHDGIISIENNEISIVKPELIIKLSTVG